MRAFEAMLSGNDFAKGGAQLPDLRSPENCRKDRQDHRLVWLGRNVSKPPCERGINPPIERLERLKG